jgi:hypothetical protein
MKPRNIKQLQNRSKELYVNRINRNTLVVSSKSNPVANHIVTVYFGDEGEVHARCTCTWAVNGGIACAHVMAALEHLAALRQRKLSFWENREEARRQKHRVFHIAGSREDRVWITSRTA